ncbi:PAS domain S-box-containing protein [Limimonas halophila]|uniref:histidine kinase n=1 Tax=Limimonas halophila TaxID=1082479 RepID=A0A1G7QNG1_9PROT|nr:ATP-binding protein [Limimonas halophila]SDG00042.1 PAS domain S-box-containing protein [Limimonas halophila]
MRLSSAVRRLRAPDIGLKLFVQNAVGGLGMAALIVLVLVVAERSTDALRRVDSVTERTIFLNQQIVEPLGRLRQHTLSLVLAPGAERRATVDAKVAELTEELDGAIARWRRRASGEAAERAARLQTAWTAYKDLIRHTRTQMEAGRREAAYLTVTGRGRKQFAALQSLMTESMGRLNGRSDRLHDQAVTNSVATRNVAIGIALFTALALGLAGWVLTRSISRPVAALTGAMRRLAEGDLDAEVPARERGDEIGRMARTVQIFRENARERERLRAEHAHAEEARTRLLEILENTPDVIGMATPDGRTTYINPATEWLIGLDRDAVAGRTIEQYHPRWATERVLHEALPTALAGGVWTGETALLTADGTEIPVSQVIFAHFDSQGEVIRLSTIMRDISDQKRMERHLVEARDQAAAANAAKTRFLSTMSHELRTPLNAIIGMSEVIRDRLLGDDIEQYASYADDIRKSGGHLLELVNDLLDMSRLEAGRYELNPEPLQTGEILHECARMVEPRAEPAGISLGVDRTAPRLLADERALRQVVLNLLTNAVKFAGEGGRVTVGAARTDAGDLAIAVTDTGPGIAEADLDRVLHPFEKSEERLSSDHQEGTGLGLAITRQLMTLHDGELYLASAPGEGTTATAVFPAGRVLDDGQVRSVAGRSA